MSAIDKAPHPGNGGTDHRSARGDPGGTVRPSDPLPAAPVGGTLSSETIGTSVSAMSGIFRTSMSWLPALTFLGLSLVGSVWLNLSPKPEGPVAAVFPPWWSAGDSFAAAAGSGAPIVRLGTLASIVVVAGGNPSIHRRLHEAGALLVIDPGALGGCLEDRKS